MRLTIVLALSLSLSSFASAFLGTPSLLNFRALQTRRRQHEVPLQQGRLGKRNGLIQMNQVGGPQFVKICMGNMKKEQMLPMSMVQGFSKWIKCGNELRPLFNSDSYGEEEGWVDPVSFNELWLPKDLPQPLIRPALTALIKDGVIRYIMPGLDVSITAQGKLWWNRGIASFPLPASWAEIGSCDLAKLRMVAFTQSGYKQAEFAIQQANIKHEDELKPWKKIWQFPAKDYVVNLVETLADECGEVLENGFHIVVLPDENGILMPAPDAGTRLRILLTDSPFEPLMQDPKEKSDLGEIDHDGAEMDILCRRVSAGGDSDYLPEVYKELYSMIQK